MSSSQLPTPSGHVRNRFAQRAPRFPGALAAWLEAKPFTGGDLTGDEFRYHRETNTVLIRNDDTLTTVISASTARSAVQRDIRSTFDVEPARCSRHE